MWGHVLTLNDGAVRGVLRCCVPASPDETGEYLSLFHIMPTTQYVSITVMCQYLDGKQLLPLSGHNCSCCNRTWVNGMHRWLGCINFLFLLSHRATIQRCPVTAWKALVRRAIEIGRSWWPFWNRDCEVCFLVHCGIASILHSEHGYQELYWHCKSPIKVEKIII